MMQAIAVAFPQINTRYLVTGLGDPLAPEANQIAECEREKEALRRELSDKSELLEAKEKIIHLLESRPS